MAATLHGGDGRDGLRVAKLFRQYRVGIDVRKCDLEGLATEDSIEIVDSAITHPGYAACLVRSPDGAGGLIALQPGQSAGRRRFSIAHELGHYHIPTHKNVVGHCGERDMRARLKDANQQEWEANDFATELLMPRKLFSEDSRRLDISIASASALAGADNYEVSVLAAAWRIVQTTREAAAIVVSTAGYVEWIFRSDAFRLPLTERGQPLHPNTLAATSLREGRSESQPLDVDLGAWLD